MASSDSRDYSFIPKLLYVVFTAVYTMIVLALQIADFTDHPSYTFNNETNFIIINNPTHTPTNCSQFSKNDLIFANSGLLYSVLMFWIWFCVRILAFLGCIFGIFGKKRHGFEWGVFGVMVLDMMGASQVYGIIAYQWGTCLQGPQIIEEGTLARYGATALFAFITFVAIYTVGWNKIWTAANTKFGSKPVTYGFLGLYIIVVILAFFGVFEVVATLINKFPIFFGVQIAAIIIICLLSIKELVSAFRVESEDNETPLLQPGNENGDEAAYMRDVDDFKTADDRVPRHSIPKPSKL
mmetsp:Transcript_41882/g.48219  ORF Transcript_41882/g.48219 Transcript_41882/m.48219 type:complete len:296 (+) Transcript_41882:462-1349(+)|eukprot:CAMPEP_0115008888 /NCGR_PEP_ID=MMETSP0216-20121206/22230_1 /TAXON_ID=223996 /ORGANISM="Protocruzia adherens, Strain Boccale" /LENGTH=295 /DNA_ID=CAMNT_0002376481 /DNA_START=437 /DNA_END=1324 /DNA_ORIENTATION=+